MFMKEVPFDLFLKRLVHSALRFAKCFTYFSLAHKPFYKIGDDAGKETEAERGDMNCAESHS